MIYQIEQKKDEALVKIKNNLLLCHVQQDRVHQISHYIQYICFHDISYVYAWMEEPLVAEAARSEKMPFLPFLPQTSYKFKLLNKLALMGAD